MAKFSDYSFPVDKYSDSKVLYGEICSRLPALNEIGRVHFRVTRACIITHLATFVNLLDSRKDWAAAELGEMGRLLSSITNVESANVPVALKVTSNCNKLVVILYGLIAYLFVFSKKELT